MASQSQTLPGATPSTPSTRPGAGFGTFLNGAFSLSGARLGGWTHDDLCHDRHASSHDLPYSERGSCCGFHTYSEPRKSYRNATRRGSNCCRICIGDDLHPGGYHRCWPTIRSHTFSGLSSRCL